MSLIQKNIRRTGFNIKQVCIMVAYWPYGDDKRIESYRNLYFDAKTIYNYLLFWFTDRKRFKPMSIGLNLSKLFKKARVSDYDIKELMGEEELSLYKEWDTLMVYYDGSDLYYDVLTSWGKRNKKEKMQNLTTEGIPSHSIKQQDARC